MANALAFDTLAYARRLKEAGVDDAQAEAHAEAVRDAVMEGVATKADLETSIAGLRTALKADVARLEGKIENIDAKMERFAAKTEIESTDVKIGNFSTKADKNPAPKVDLFRLLRIQIGIITGTVVASSGAVVALIKLLP